MNFKFALLLVSFSLFHFYLHRSYEEDIISAPLQPSDMMEIELVLDDFWAQNQIKNALIERGASYDLLTSATYSLPVHVPVLSSVHEVERNLLKDISIQTFSTLWFRSQAFTLPFFSLLDETDWNATYMVAVINDRTVADLEKRVDERIKFFQSLGVFNLLCGTSAERWRKIKEHLYQLKVEKELVHLRSILSIRKKETQVQEIHSPRPKPVNNMFHLLVTALAIILVIYHDNILVLARRHRLHLERRNRIMQEIEREGYCQKKMPHKQRQKEKTQVS